MVIEVPLVGGKKQGNELHWRKGRLHGIEREWNPKGRLRRGWPRYFVAGRRLDKRRYLRACAGDTSLPEFRSQDGVSVRDLKRVLAGG